MRDVASKTADNAVRLAALFHVMTHGVNGAIAVDTFEGASRIAAWHLNEARRFFGELALPDEMADATRLNEWLVTYCRKECVTSVSFGTVLQRGPKRVRRKEKLMEALRELEDAGRVHASTMGRSKTIHLNPALLKIGGA